MPNRLGFARAIALVGGLVLAGSGAWAFFSPRSFFDALAVFPPYNRHFIHDVGAFQIGLGAVLLFALYRTDALFVALAGVSVGSALHVVSHVMDSGIGGTPVSDIPLLTILTVLLIVAAVVVNRTDATTSRAAPRSEEPPR